MCASALTTAAVARALDTPENDILSCSTGVIGGGFDAERIGGAVEELVSGLADGNDAGRAFAEAISTTDTVIKEAKAEVGPYRLGACAKGAAMVEPRLDLATMLVFFTTDAPLSVADAKELSRTSLKPAFEQLTIDGCTSTNDTVLLFANGAAGGTPIERGTPEWDGLAVALREMGDSLAYQLAADAEGGTKVLLVDVEGAADDADAQTVAKAIANSVLVKTAAFGADPNPGRFVQALGSSGGGFDPSRARVVLGDVVVIDGGRVLADYDEGGRAHQVMKEDEIHVTVGIGDGPGRARAIGCDLSYEYVKINAEYTT
jgi:glutamate N-acetyltransferase/amino-acid N-acetyltransferase